MVASRTERASDQVREFLLGHPNLRKVLGQGLINDAALARRIRTESGERLSFEAVAVALRRVEREILRDVPVPQSPALLLGGGPYLELRPDYTVLRFPDRAEVLTGLLEAPQRRALGRRNPHVMIHVEEGAPYISVACPTREARGFESAAGGAHPKRTDDLAMVVLQTQGGASRTPGVIASLADLLGDRNLLPRWLVAAEDRVELVSSSEEARRVFALLHEFRRPSGPPREDRAAAKPLSRSEGPAEGERVGPMEGTVDPRSGAEITRQYVSEHPSIADCLAYGVVNITALARRISEATGFRRVEALEAALRRWRAEGTGGSVEDRILSVVRQSRIEVRTRVALATGPVGGRLLGRLLSARGGGPPDRRRVFQVLQGPSEVIVLCDEDLLDPVVRGAGARGTLEVLPDLAAVVVRSPEAILETPGVLAFLSGALYRAGINCREVMSLHIESTFVVRQSDALATFRVLSDLVHPPGRD